MGFDPVLDVISIIIAVVVANVAMWILFFLRRKKFRIISALVMGVAVCGMHCTVHSANLRAWQPFDWNTQTKGNRW
jgi:NO-binding membrane sensor protein with MHYT domain